MPAPEDDDQNEAARELEERSAILKRRAIFVASALASLSLPVAASNCEPKPCLEAPAVEVPVTVDLPAAGAPTTTSATATAPPSASAPPRTCLKKAPPPPPTVCLEAPF